MMRLLRTEWLKMKKYPAFWWMLGILALSYPGVNYAVYAYGYKDQLEDPRIGPVLQLLPNPFTFPDVWQTVAFISSLFIILPALLVIMFITNEYTYKTHRQNVIDGWSRSDFMLGKMIDVALISLLVTGLYTVTALVIGQLNAGAGTPAIWNGAHYIGLFFLQAFSQLSLALLVALLVRKAFIALGLFFFYYFPFEPIIVGISRKQGWGFREFLPLELSDRLIPYPHWIIRSDADWRALLVQSDRHIVYTLLFTALTWVVCFRINKKRDL